jgi:hypothetical protein
MRTTSGIYGSHGQGDGQLALGCEGDYVENFLHTQVLGRAKTRQTHLTSTEWGVQKNESIPQLVGRKEQSNCRSLA